MNRKIHTKSLLIAICGVVGLNSCRQSEIPITPDKDPKAVVTPTPDNKEGEEGRVPITLNVVKSYGYEDSTPGDIDESYVDFLGHGKRSMGALEIQRRLDSPKDEILESGVHYRVLAYSKDEEHFYYTLERNEDFIAGSNNKLELDKSKNYTIIAYSFGSTDIVPFPNNLDDINKVNLDYTKAKRLFYAIKENYTPSADSDRLDIQLKDQITSIKVVLDASDFFGGNVKGKIEKIENSKLIYRGHSKAVLRLGSAKREIESNNKEVSVNLSFSGTNDARKESDWKYIILSPENNDLTFETKVSMDEPMKGVNLGKIKTKIRVRKGLRQTFTLNQQLCGALIDDGAWRQFMCYDLGASEGVYPRVNPFQPKIAAGYKTALHGAKFHWGYPYNGARKIDASYDSEPYSGVEFKRNSNRNMPNKWTDLAHIWDNDDPCPDGYRVPTDAELTTLASFKFTGIGINDWDYNWGAGFLLDSQKGNLFFPASGDRRWAREDHKNGIRWHGRRTAIWSSTSEIGGSRVPVARAMTIYGDRNSEAKVEGFRVEYPEDGAISPYYSIRCIKK